MSTNLSVLVQHVSVQVEVVWKSLRSGTLTDRHDSSLFRVQDSTLLSHWLRVSDSGGEESIPGNSSIEASPVVMPVGCVRQAPWDESVFLLVGFNTLLLAWRAVANATERSILGFALFKKVRKTTIPNDCYRVVYLKQVKTVLPPV